MGEMYLCAIPECRDGKCVRVRDIICLGQQSVYQKLKGGDVCDGIGLLLRRVFIDFVFNHGLG